MKFFRNLESLELGIDFDDLERAVDGKDVLKFPINGKFDQKASSIICEALNVDPVDIEFYLNVETVSRKKRIYGDMYYGSEIPTEVCFTLSFEETKRFMNK